jgi:hypothetical protein
MPFDAITRTVLDEHYTAHPPAIEESDVWYGPWTTMLTTLFPSTQGYRRRCGVTMLVTPQRRLTEDPESHIPDFVIVVVELSMPPPPLPFEPSSLWK